MKKPVNQWEESAALRLMEKMGCIRRVSLGEHIEIPIDYRPNPDVAVMVNDQDTAALLKTETITSAVYDIAQLSVPVTWTKGDDAKNPTENQKVSLVKALLENGIASHDDLLEQTIFVTSAAGGVEILGLDSLVPDSGAGSPGGIAATTEAWWQNFADTYTDATDIEATMTAAYNAALKGTGSTDGPKFLLSGADAHALYESVLQSLQRFADVKEADGGFKTLMFKSLPYSFSQYGDDHIYFLSPKSYNMVVSKEYFRDKGPTETVPGQNAFYFLIYSAMQNVVTNKSRLAVISQA
jgi:hypothetical protein